MKQTVDDVQAQLAGESVSKSSSVAASALRADENFAVLKCDHVGRSRFIHELSMQRRDLSIRDNQNQNRRQLLKFCLFLARELETKSQGFAREFFQIGNVDRNFAL